jgi:glutaminyl-tRNA synthetase
MPDPSAAPPRDFLRALVADDLRTGRRREVVTRFPPEPNGYLHIGHAKSIGLNFGIAKEFGGRCHLRFDDTNPATEDERYVRAIMEDVRWLGYDWGEHLYFASDYFERMYALAEWLVREGHAYVDSQSEAEIREGRGTVIHAGVASPHRDRAADESLELLRRMKAGEFPDGAHVLRARIDMASPNMLLRDPVLYRIRHARHHRTGDTWCIYPLYDYAHTVEDAIECVTHSLCTLEFDVHRPLYDWMAERWVEFVRAEGGEPCRPVQTEFARGSLDYTVMSKRMLLTLVRDGRVEGWDDPRMPTLAGLRRRGVTPEAIRSFWEMVGVAKANSRVDIGKLEYAVRDDLNHRAPRVMGVLDPLRVVLTDYPEDAEESFDAPLWPRDVPREGTRPLPFARELFIEREDFREDPPKGFHRLVPGGLVRLRYAYVIRCEEVVRDEGGEVVELRCSHLPDTRGGASPEGKKVKGTIHWVSARHAVRCEARLYDRLFTVPQPEAEAGEFTDYLNPESLVVREALVEPWAAAAGAGAHLQFERVGYFYADPADWRAERPAFNRTVTLRDTWARSQPEAAGDSAPQREEAPEPPPATAAGGERRGEPPRRTAEEERRRAALEGRGVGSEEAEVLARDAEAAALFEGAVSAGASPRGGAAWVVHELPREAQGRGVAELPFGGSELGRLVVLLEQGALSSSGARQLLTVLASEGGDPDALLERLGLRQVSDDDALLPLVEEVLAANAPKAEAYRAGKRGLLGFFVGEVMRRSGGSANPGRVKELLSERLDRG